MVRSKAYVVKVMRQRGRIFSWQKELEVAESMSLA